MICDNIRSLIVSGTIAPSPSSLSPLPCLLTFLFLSFPSLPFAPLSEKKGVDCQSSYFLLPQTQPHSLYFHSSFLLQLHFLIFYCIPLLSSRHYSLIPFILLITTRSQRHSSQPSLSTPHQHSRFSFPTDKTYRHAHTYSARYATSKDGRRPAGQEYLSAPFRRIHLGHVGIRFSRICPSSRIEGQHNYHLCWAHRCMDSRCQQQQR